MLWYHFYPFFLRPIDAEPEQNALHIHIPASAYLLSESTCLQNHGYGPAKEPVQSRRQCIPEQIHLWLPGLQYAFRARFPRHRQSKYSNARNWMYSSLPDLNYGCFPVHSCRCCSQDHRHYHRNGMHNSFLHHIRYMHASVPPHRWSILFRSCEHVSSLLQ